MNKPVGYVCSAVSDSHKTVYELLPKEYQALMQAKRGERLHTVGRLDCDSSGLIIFTNDGDFSHKLTDPAFQKEKVYVVTLKNPVSPEEQLKIIDIFSRPMVLPPEKKAPEQITEASEIEFLSENECRVTIRQGMFHQIRRMFLAVGNEVVKLHRIKLDSYELPEDLSAGQWKEL